MRIVECLLCTRLWDRCGKTAGGKQSQPSFWPTLFLWSHGALSWTLTKTLESFVLAFPPFLSKWNISEGCYKCLFLKMLFRTKNIGNGMRGWKACPEFSGVARPWHKCPLSHLRDFRNLLGTLCPTHCAERGKLWPLSTFLLGPLRSSSFWSDLLWLECTKGWPGQCLWLNVELKQSGTVRPEQRTKFILILSTEVRKRIVSEEFPWADGYPSLRTELCH